MNPLDSKEEALGDRLRCISAPLSGHGPVNYTGGGVYVIDNNFNPYNAELFHGIGLVSEVIR